MGRSLKEDRRSAMARGGETRGRKTHRTELPHEYAATPSPSPEPGERRALARAARLAEPAFSPQFQQKHVMPGGYTSDEESRGAIRQSAVSTANQRERQRGMSSIQRDNAPNTVMGLTPKTRRHVENYVRQPAVQDQFRRNESVNVPFPAREEPNRRNRHSSYAATANPMSPTRGQTVDTYQPAGGMTVKGVLANPTGSNPYYQVNHLKGVY